MKPSRGHQPSEPHSASPSHFHRTSGHFFASSSESLRLLCPGRGSSATRATPLHYTPSCLWLLRPAKAAFGSAHSSDLASAASIPPPLRELPSSGRPGPAALASPPLLLLLLSKTFLEARNYYTVRLQPTACLFNPRVGLQRTAPGSIWTSNGWLSLFARLHRAAHAHDSASGPLAPTFRVTSPSPGSRPALAP